MLPIIEREALTHMWLTQAQYADAVTLAGMAPGPIAMNSAVYVGYTAAGLAGSLAASLGVVLPSAIIMLLVATIFYKMYDNHWVQAALDGMKPAVIALIAYAAVNMTMNADLLSGWSNSTYISIGIFVLALLALVKLRIHPIAVILISGIAGMVLYA